MEPPPGLNGGGTPSEGKRRVSCFGQSVRQRRGEECQAHAEPRLSPSSIVLSIVVAIGVLGGIAYWDEGREAQAALDDFAHEQATLAKGVAAALEPMVASQKDPELEAVALRRAFAPVAEPETLALLQGPEQTGFVSSTGTGALFSMPALERSAGEEPCGYSQARGEKTSCWKALSREEAASLGLPERRAMAGESGFTDSAGGAWRVVVVATARRERDRERRAGWRLVLGFALTSGLVLAFGTLALRKQQKELALYRELSVREAVRARDERLIRADKLATLGALAIGIAHEVSTPLGVIVGRAEQLAPRVKDDERAQRAVTAIAEQANRIESVVRSLLTLARGGAPSLDPAPPKRLAAAAVELVEHRFQAARVTLRLETEEPLPDVACDARLLEQALVNLVLNACDACSEGGRVDLRVERTADRVAFVVIDDGPGIGADAALRATEPFFTTKPEGKGTGLGLAIANEIVGHHQGTFSIGPRPGGRGTEARIELPLAGTERHE
jgi:two-component system NtrC family sensor kinase